MAPTTADSTERGELPGEILAVAGRLADLIGGLPRADVPIPGADWTVAEAAAHLAMANELMATIAAGRPATHGDGTKAGLAAANAQALSEDAEREPAVLAQRIAGQAAAFLEAARVRPAAEIVDTPMGPMPLGVFGCYLLAHMLSHGTAIAAALRQPPIVRPRHVELILPFIHATMPRLVDQAAVRGLSACYELRLRGVSRFWVRFTDGAAAVSDTAPGRVDCTISVDPVSFFLLSAGLSGQWPLIARGKLRAWGRRPWLAFRFLNFFAIP
ncbi:maleylpyruvate isomerase family mycothiol-dependent enzyme [Micromonospora soli]|uniref:maleylpyruvate isomerase family mycothiol-dependent enzyme n=1 Tax=Micromonospora sp. NBRC 110009 TaxID=3061627 RepID=UPI002671F938|nr:maleylpyruvate isomerase family mycothiol-dependent enzyme [Micromonospora sp. NBRC 110009]WKT99890.1 maleylpyruvate isomerase family mycothiol-dependent enzyme [Micromonospora sp. NBRC 110009]